jgi:hypothetical protein
LKIKLDKEANEPKNRNNFLSVTVNEIGRLEYKINWQETEKATLDDIKKTYKYIKSIKKRKMNKIVQKIIYRSNHQNRILFKLKRSSFFRYRCKSPKSNFSFFWHLKIGAHST